MRDTKRGSQSYMEKRRRMREIVVTRRRRGAVKRVDSNLASNHFPMCSPQSGTPERFTELHREEKREEGTIGDQEEKRVSQKGRDQSGQ